MRRHFDLDRSLIYLNSGTQSLTPRVVLRAQARLARKYERNPTQGLLAAWDGIWRAHECLGGFFRADPADLFLRPNITAVMNAFIQGAPIAAGKEIAVTDLEYGAIVNACRFRAEKEGRSLRVIEASGDARRMLSRLDDRVGMLVASHVATGTGLVLPIEKIAAATRKLGIALVVDGAHSAGALDLDFRKLSDVDYYGANLHKWMMGPKGTAFGWVAPRNQASLSPGAAGWTTYGIEPPFLAFQGKPFAARMLLQGCHDFAPYLALPEVIAFWRRQSAAAIRKRLARLQQAVEDEVGEKLGWQRVSPPPGPARGPLLSFEVPARLQAEGFGVALRVYREHRVQLASAWVRGRWLLRFSPHVYNTEREIAAAVRKLERL